MTRAQRLATNLRQLPGLLYALGFLATMGFLLLFLTTISDETPNTWAAAGIIIYTIVMWVGIAWMALVVSGIAELLAPTPPELGSDT